MQVLPRLLLSLIAATRLCCPEAQGAWQSWGADTVCRLDVHDTSTDGLGSTVLLEALENLEVCKRACEQEPTCLGVEYGLAGRCELWSYPIGAAFERSGFECLSVRREALLLSCNNLECPPGFVLKPDAAERHCNGSICTIGSDLNTCCDEIRCSLPANTSGYDVRGCSASEWLPEHLCEVSCKQYFGTFGSRPRPTRTCNSTGQNFTFDGCNDDLHVCVGRIAQGLLNGIVHLIPFNQSIMECNALDRNHFLGNVELTCHANATVMADTSECIKWWAVLQDVHSSGRGIQGSLFIHGAEGAADRGIREFRVHWAESGPHGPCHGLLAPALAAAAAPGGGQPPAPLELPLGAQAVHTNATHLVVLAVDELGQELADVCVALNLSEADLEVVPAELPFRTVRTGEFFTVEVTGRNLPVEGNVAFFSGISACRNQGPDDINWNLNVDAGVHPVAGAGVARAQSREAVLLQPGDYTACLPVPGGPGARLRYVDLGLTVRVSNDTYVGPLLTTGYQHTCVGLGSKVKCWGDGTLGQLGLEMGGKRGDNIGEMGDALPYLNLGGTNPLELEAGSRHTCIVDSSHRVKCWGQASHGQLGYEDTRQRGDDAGEMGDDLPAVNLGTNVSGVHISAGDLHTCAVLTGGRLKCWGLGHSGRTGQEDTQIRGDDPGEMGDALPFVQLGENATVDQVSAAFLHTCASLADGSVKCWGNNAFGQLGLEDTENRGDEPGEMGDNLPKVDLCSGCTVLQLGSGEAHNCALLDNHRVKCWGRGSSGRLGYEDSRNRGDDSGEMGDALPYLDFGTGRTVMQLYTGFVHSCVLLDNKGVKCWGVGFHGQLGYGDRMHRGNDVGEMGDALPYVDLGTGRTALHMSLGEFHTCAYLDNSRVKCWGGNSDGELGYQDAESRGVSSGDMGDGLPYIDFGVIFFENEFEEANCTMGQPCSVTLRGRTGMDHRSRLLLGSPTAGCDVLSPAQMGESWRTMAAAQCSNNEDFACRFNFHVPVQVLPSMQGLPLCFWQSEDLPYTARHTVGNMTFAGPFNLQPEPLLCSRGQFCELTLRGGTVPGVNWPSSRLLVGTGSCRNLSLAHIFPSHINLPGVSSWATKVGPGTYKYTYPRTGTAEPQRYSICWCAMGRDATCQKRLDFSVSASDFLMVGPFTPTERHVCWRSRNCTATAFGTHLTTSDGLRICDGSTHFSFNNSIRPMELVLRTHIESVRMMAMIIGPIAAEVGPYSICWCPAGSCSPASSPEDFGATFALLLVSGPRLEANINSECHVGSSCSIRLLGMGNASTLELHGVMLKRIQSDQAGARCADGEVVVGPVLATRPMSPAWPLVYDLELPADASLIGHTFLVCWCGVPDGGLEGGLGASCDMPEDFSAEAGTLEVRRPLCTESDEWAPQGSATCQRCREFHSSFEEVCAFDYIYFLWTMTSLSAIFIALFIPFRRLGLRIRIVDMSVQNEKLVITTLGQHSIIVWRGISTEVTLSGTGIPRFDEPGNRFRVRVVDSERLELLEENGKTPVKSGESSMGMLRQRLGFDILNTGLFLPMAGILVPVPLLTTPTCLGIAYAVWIVQQLRKAAVIGSASLGFVLAVTISVWERRRYHLHPSVLQKRYRQYRRQLLEALPTTRRQTITTVERGPDRAVSAGQLFDVLIFFKDLIKFRDMYYINACITKPLTAPFRTSFAELAGPSRVEYFVSHFWGTPFQHFVDSIKKHAEGESFDDWRKVRYWICSLSNNQWEVAKELGYGQWEDSSFYKALKCEDCRGTCMVLDSQAIPLTRSWCLFEVLQTYLRAGDGNTRFRGLFFCTSTGVLNSGSAGYDVAVTLARRLSQLRVQDGAASVESDKLMIDGLLAKTGFERINRFVRKQINRTLEGVKVQFEADVDELNVALDETEASAGLPTQGISKMHNSNFRGAVRSSTWKLKAEQALTDAGTNGSDAAVAPLPEGNRQQEASPDAGFLDEIRHSLESGLNSPLHELADASRAEESSHQRPRKSAGLGAFLPPALSRRLRLLRCTSGHSGNSPRSSRSRSQDERDSEKSCAAPMHHFVLDTKAALEKSGDA